MIFLRYAVWRFITMLLTLWVVSLLVFVIINLPPGDYLSNQIAELRATFTDSQLPTSNADAQIVARSPSMHFAAL